MLGKCLILVMSLMILMVSGAYIVSPTAIELTAAKMSAITGGDQGYDCWGTQPCGPPMKFCTTVPGQQACYNGINPGTVVKCNTGNYENCNHTGPPVGCYQIMICRYAAAECVIIGYDEHEVFDCRAYDD